MRTAGRAGQSGDDPSIDVEPADWLDAQEVIEVVNLELHEWALVREKVVDQIDLPAARHARALSFELRVLASAREDFTRRPNELGALLASCHALLAGAPKEPDTLDESGARRVRPASDARLTAPPPATYDLSVASGDDESEDTRLGLPEQVMEEYLRGGPAKAGGT